MYIVIYWPAYHVKLKEMKINTKKENHNHKQKLFNFHINAPKIGN